MPTDSVITPPRLLPQCPTCGLRHPSVVVAFPDAKPDPMQCIHALGAVVCGLTMALVARDLRPLQAAVKTYYGE